MDGSLLVALVGLQFVALVSGHGMIELNVTLISEEMERLRSACVAAENEDCLVSVYACLELAGLPENMASNRMDCNRGGEWIAVEKSLKSGAEIGSDFVEPLVTIHIRFEQPWTGNMSMKIYINQGEGLISGMENPDMFAVRYSHYVVIHLNSTARYGWSQPVIAIAPEADANGKVNCTYKVMCDDYFYPPCCESQCRWLKSITMERFICDENGTLVCSPGWTDPMLGCTTPICMDGCQGNCTKPYACDICPPGMYGELCDQPIDKVRKMESMSAPETYISGKVPFTSKSNPVMFYEVRTSKLSSCLTEKCDYITGYVLRHMFTPLATQQPCRTMKLRQQIMSTANCKKIGMVLNKWLIPKNSYATDFCASFWFLVPDAQKEKMNLLCEKSHINVHLSVYMTVVSADRPPMEVFTMVFGQNVAVLSSAAPLFLSIEDFYDPATMMSICFADILPNGNNCTRGLLKKSGEFLFRKQFMEMAFCTVIILSIITYCTYMLLKCCSRTFDPRCLCKLFWKAKYAYRRTFGMNRVGNSGMPATDHGHVFTVTTTVFNVASTGRANANQSANTGPVQLLGFTKLTDERGVGRAEIELPDEVSPDLKV